jgi:hypothetical protein
MTPHWPKPPGFDGRLRFIVPGHDTTVPVRDATLVARAPEPHAERSR